MDPYGGGSEKDDVSLCLKVVTANVVWNIELAVVSLVSSCRKNVSL